MNIHGKCIMIVLSFALFLGVLAGCTRAESSATAPVVTEEEVVLTIAGGWLDCRALDEAANAFSAKYPNCTIVYEYLQDYYKSLEKRMAGESPVDVFFTTNIQDGSALLPYALDLNNREDLDLSDTFDGLIENFMFREESGENTKLYAIPLGAEMRGLYVNKTLLSSLNLDVPTDQASLLAACAALQEHGYIPFHGNPGNFAQMLIYPWICNLITNAGDPQAAHDRVDACEPGLSEMFRKPYEFLYLLVENDYYDYKTVQSDLGLFTDTTDEAYARNFLNVVRQGDTWMKADDMGRVPFLPSPISLQTVINKTKEDYHSEIEYVFILAPVGENGGYAYLSPAHGIAVNKLSANTEWAVKFLNFLFQPENNEAFAKTFNVIPNTKEAFSYIKTLYDIPESYIMHLGQVTFSYGFYEMLQPSLTDISKANNPKYMGTDENGKLVLYPFGHYMEELEAAIQERQKK
ncbi:MAG: ABC transporter substrate-binding protein [Sphaerochaetaceae bacterium]|nr:ABC transporter substrate-binding protein [Sphaerochaetaceae bacterium]